MTQLKTALLKSAWTGATGTIFALLLSTSTGVAAAPFTCASLLTPEPIIELSQGSAFKIARARDLRDYLVRTHDFQDPSDDGDTVTTNEYRGIHITNIQLRWPDQLVSYHLGKFPNGSAIAVSDEIISFENIENIPSFYDYKVLMPDGHYPIFGFVRVAGGVRFIRPIIAGRYVRHALASPMLTAGPVGQRDLFGASSGQLIQWETDTKIIAESPDAISLNFVPEAFMNSQDLETTDAMVRMDLIIDAMTKITPMFLTASGRFLFDTPSWEQKNVLTFSILEGTGVRAMHNEASLGPLFRYTNWVRLMLLSQMTSTKETKAYLQWLRKKKFEKYYGLVSLVSLVQLHGRVPSAPFLQLTYEATNHGKAIVDLIHQSENGLLLTSTPLRFKTKELEDAHTKHFSEFKVATMEEYLGLAKDALAGKRGEYYYFHRTDGTAVVMARYGEWFLTISPDGFLNTFFAPSFAANKFTSQPTYFWNDFYFDLKRRGFFEGE